MNFAGQDDNYLKQENVHIIGKKLGIVKRQKGRCGITASWQSRRLLPSRRRDVTLADVCWRHLVAMWRWRRPLRVADNAR